MKKILLSLFVLIPLFLSAQVTITMEQDGGVYKVPCVVNGAKMKCIFYTGAATVCLSESMAEYLLDNDYIPKDDIILNGDVLSVKLSNISVKVHVRFFWDTYIVRFTAPCLANYYVEVKCSDEKFFEFLKCANEESPKALDKFEVLKQEMEQKMKKTIAEVIFAREKKEKARSVTVTSIETIAKQRLKSYGVENLSFEHKKIVSHIFANFKDGKQQIDIAIKHSDLQKAIETIDNAGRIIEMIQKNDVVVRGKVGYGYDS